MEVASLHLKNMKKKFNYYLGGIIAFFLKNTKVYAQQDVSLYGVWQDPPIIQDAIEPSIWEKTITFIQNQSFTILLFTLALVIGTIIYLMKKNVKRNN